jgi:hypothetical protein
MTGDSSCAEGHRSRRYPDCYLPGLRKSRLLYNEDLARQQPLVLVCEGVTDVCRVGPAEVALFGKSASRQQLLRSAHTFAAQVYPRRPLVRCRGGLRAAVERSDFKGAPDYASSDFTTFPATSVRRKSRPW